MIQVITSRGNVFILNQESDNNSRLGSLGVNLKIVPVTPDGVLIHGITHTGDTTTMRPYSYHTDENYFIAGITSMAPKTIHSIPEFNGKYVHDGVRLQKTSNTLQNVLGYTGMISDGSSVNVGTGGLVFSGNDRIIIQLNNFSGSTLSLTGMVPEGSELYFATSLYDIMNMPYDQALGFTIHTESFSASTTGECTHRHVLRGGNSYWHYHLHNVQFDHTTSVLMGDSSAKTIQYQYTRNYDTHQFFCTPYTASATQTGVKNLDIASSFMDGDYTRITEISGTDSHGYWSGTLSYHDTEPVAQIRQFDSSFENIFEFDENTRYYLIARPNGNDISIRGAVFDSNVPIFSVSNLTANIPFMIEKNGITGVSGISSGIGKITLFASDVSFFDDSHGALLHLYHQSISYRGNSSAILFDTINDVILEINVGNLQKLTYVPFAYIRFASPVDFVIESVFVDSISFDYLAGSYSSGNSIMIPVIPSMNNLYMRIDGTDIQVQLEDINSDTTIKTIPVMESILSEYMVNDVTVITSDVSSSAFVIATQTGTLNGIINTRVSGYGEFSINSAYTGVPEGGYQNQRKCWIAVIKTISTGVRCTYNTVPLYSVSVDGLNDLSAQYQTQINDALARNSASNLAVYVDVYKNGQYEQNASGIIYQSDMAHVSLPSSIQSLEYLMGHTVHFEYMQNTIQHAASIFVNAGDMVEFVVRINLGVAGIPAPPVTGSDVNVSSYAKAGTKFHGGPIITGMG